MKAMILAAGLGTRLRPLTNTVPKPAVPLLNIPIGYWPLYHLLRAGVDELVVNTHYLPEKVVTLYKSVQGRVKTLNFTLEEKKILGSGGGIGFAREYLQSSRSFATLFKSLYKPKNSNNNNGAFWVANADEIFLPEDPALFSKVWTQHQVQNNLATLVLVQHPDVGTKFGGVWCDSQMNVRGFGKASPAPGLKPYHFTGFQILSSNVFKYIPPGESNIFYDVLVQALSKGERVGSIVDNGLWFETGNIEDLKLATEHLNLLKEKNPTLQSLIKEFALK